MKLATHVHAHTFITHTLAYTHKYTYKHRQRQMHINTHIHIKTQKDRQIERRTHIHTDTRLTISDLYCPTLAMRASSFDRFRRRYVCGELTDARDDVEDALCSDTALARAADGVGVVCELGSGVLSSAPSISKTLQKQAKRQKEGREGLYNTQTSIDRL